MDKLLLEGLVDMPKLVAGPPVTSTDTNGMRSPEDTVKEAGLQVTAVTAAEDEMRLRGIDDR